MAISELDYVNLRGGYLLDLTLQILSKHLPQQK